MGSARALVAAVFAIAIGVVAPLSAQTPAGDATRPITLVVPIAAGGGMDTIGRTLAERLQERLKQPVVVENRVGAGGVTGVDYAAKAAPEDRPRDEEQRDARDLRYRLAIRARPIEGQ